MTYDFVAQQRAWAAPPVDHLNRYVPAAELLTLPDHELRTLVQGMAAERFGGWRNHNNLWRDVLGLDTTRGRRILDFGCGVGLEALEYVKTGNTVDVADIADDNLALAARVIQVCGQHRPPAQFTVGDRPPFIDAPDGVYDVFHCSGVLHHIPYPRAIMQVAHRLLVPAGEARLMLYSDEGWRQATGTEPPEDAAAHPQFATFVRHFDQVGAYADWYDADRLAVRFGDLFDLVRLEYLTPWRQYLGAVLRRKEQA